MFKLKIIRLKPVVLAPRGGRPGQIKLVFFSYFHFNIREKFSVIRWYT